VTYISHHILLFNLLLSIIVYLCLFVSLSLPFTLTFLLFNLKTFLHYCSSYILVATIIMYSNLLLFSSVLVHELPSYSSLCYLQAFLKHHLLHHSSSSYYIYTIIIPHYNTTLTSYSVINIIFTHYIYIYIYIYIFHVFVNSTSCLEHTSIISFIPMAYMFFPSDMSYPSLSALRYLSLHSSFLIMSYPLLSHYHRFMF